MPPVLELSLLLLHMLKRHARPLRHFPLPVVTSSICSSSPSLSTRARVPSFINRHRPCVSSLVQFVQARARRAFLNVAASPDVAG
ncbi:hypothetical protein EJ04DRAFT_16822 [Polyplosphaeria fusca]|uniref:Uncharacterized protein n=1 Tax=Polyplosphaeria fusca TaxID=682080 RepID=A0A9P4QRD1_9PLEO|nr:hypothetical protein EJ04DRAFT_16822 [Polyplosphaeria fusca]